jgi:hypothetical protein
MGNVICGICHEAMTCLAVNRISDRWNPRNSEVHEFWRCRHCGNKVVVINASGR